MAGPAGETITTRRPVRLEDLKHCIVCGAELQWPSLYFDRPGCSEAWIRQAREPAFEQGRMPAVKAKAGVPVKAGRRW